MKRIILTLTLGLLFVIANGQTREQLIEQAKTYYDSGDNVNAEKVTKQIIDLDSKYESNYIYWSNLGTFQGNLGKQKESLNSYNKSIKLNDKFALAYTNRAKLYYELKETDKAVKDYKTALEIDPFNQTALFDLGMIYVKQGDLVTARTFFEKLLSKYPDDYGASSNLANIKKRQGEFSEALIDFNKLITNHPNEAILYNNRADLYLKMKEYDNAIKDIDKALEINPDYLVAIITKGEIYYDKGDYENACKYFNLGISKGFQKERIATYLEKCK